MRMFISFAREDLARAQDLVEILRDAGYDPWFDEKLIPGLPWADQLLEEIRQCEVFVYALSPRSVASDWCQKEYREAVDLGKPILPVLLEAGTQVPESLASFQWADFTREPTTRDKLRLVGSIPRLLAHPRQAPDAPAEPQGVPSRATNLDPEPPAAAPPIPPPVLFLPTKTVPKEEVQNLLAEAYTVRDSDPERALLLFYQLQKMDPDFMGPRTPDYIAQQEARLKPIRLANMRRQAEALVEAREWTEVEKIARKMVDLEPANRAFLLSVLLAWIQDLLVDCDWNGAEAVGLRLHPLEEPGAKSELEHIWETAARALAESASWERALEFAQRLADLNASRTEIRYEVLRLWGEAALTEGDWKCAEQVGKKMLSLEGADPIARRLLKTSHDNALHEHQYRQAAAFLKGGRAAVALSLLEDLKAACPTYGDPAGLLSGRAIDPEFASWIRRQRTGRLGQKIHSIAFSPPSESVWVMLDEGSPCLSLRIEDLGREHLDSTEEKKIREVLSTSLLANSTSRNLRAKADGKMILLQEADSGKMIATLKGHKETVACLAFSTDGSLLASSAFTKSVWIWSTASLTRADLVSGPSGEWFMALAFSPGDDLLAAAGQQGIAVWRRLKTISYFDSSPSVLAAPQASALGFSPDGRFLVSGDTKGHLTLWDMTNFEPAVHLQAQTAEITGVAFSPNGKLLAAASANGALTLWGMGNLDGPK